MTLAPLLNASVSIQIYTFAAMGVVALGVLQFAAPKREPFRIAPSDGPGPSSWR